MEVYWFRLEVPSALRETWWTWLSPDEQARSRRFADALHGAHYLAAHARLRWLLGQQLGCAPSAVALRRGPHGKPELAGGELQFNLSHSGDYALVGMHASRALGVDIEFERLRNFPGLASRYFTAGEQAWLTGQAQLEHAFCRLWTCKEAWMKADGRGLAGLSQPEAVLSGATAELRAEGRGWWVRELGTVPGYAAAVVVDAAPMEAMEISAKELPPPR